MSLFNNYKTKYKKNIWLPEEKIIKKIIEKANSMNAVLISEFSHKDTKGQDLDLFSKNYSKKEIYNIYKKSLIKFEFDKTYRIFINDDSSISYLTLDFDKSIHFSKKIKNNINFFFNNKILDKKSFDRMNKYALCTYKIHKYFQRGMFHSSYQITDTLKLYKKLDKDSKIKTINFLKKNKIIPEWIINDLFSRKSKIDLNEYPKVNEYLLAKRIKRQNERLIYKGKINKHVFLKIRFIFAFFLGKYFPLFAGGPSLPALALIGNDGSGKTTISQEIISLFHKFDPFLIEMGGNKPYLKITKKLRSFLKKNINYPLVKNLIIPAVFFTFIIRIIDLFDKYIKYKIGMAWADSGLGLTIFDRYITDKIRGEFPDRNFFWRPLEQYFPMPDGFIYLDVEPKDSLIRKPNDNHTIDELTSKRLNYISLLSELSEYCFVEKNRNLKENLTQIKNYFFNVGYKKNKQSFSFKVLSRCFWNKNKKRFLYGNELDRKQKEH